MISLATLDGLVKTDPRRVAAFRTQLPPSKQFICPLSIAAENDQIDLVVMGNPRAPFPRQIKHPKRPTVLLVGDDPGGDRGLIGMGGPKAWQCAYRLHEWAQAAIVHGAGGEADHYAAAVSAALLVGRVVLVETTSLFVRAWAERIKCHGTLLIVARDGLHPNSHAEASL